MSQRASDACLAALTALITSFTFKMREWTGVARSIEWPLGAAVVLMVVWLVIHRRQGIRAGLLLANLIGIGLGLTVSSLVHRLGTGKPLGPSLIFAFMAATCTWMYFWIEKREREAADKIAQVSQEFESIKAMPHDRAAEAVQTQLARFENQLRVAGQQARRFLRWATILIAFGMLLTIATIPDAIRPEVKPLMVVTDAAVLTLGSAWFVKLALLKRAERKSPPPPSEAAE